MPWFMERIAAGSFDVVNPYNRRTSRVPATPGTVHSIVFWSKNFRPFLRGGYGETLSGMGFHLFFNFTVNSEDPVLEPRLPPLPDRLEQMAELAGRFGPGAVRWRFDPVCHYRTASGSLRHNLHDFTRIADTAAACGIATCITSFVDLYPKIHRRLSSTGGMEFVEISPERKQEILLRMERYLKRKDISLALCCEKEIASTLPGTSSVTHAECIPGRHLRRLYGGHVSLKKDTGQRRRQGCCCTVAKDIGDYTAHACPHGCLYCYANPVRSGPPLEPDRQMIV